MQDGVSSFQVQKVNELKISIDSVYLVTIISHLFIIVNTKFSITQTNHSISFVKLFYIKFKKST